MINNPGPPLFSVVPTGSPSKLTLLPASSIAGLTVGPLSTIYVEPPSPAGRGNDATAQRGNAALPCATLDKALALAVAALPAVSSILLAEGTYAPPSAPVSPLLQIGLIDGENEATVIIDATGTGLPCFDLSSNAARVFWRLGPNMSIRADLGAAPAIKADGGAAPDQQFFTNGALVLGGQIVGALSLAFVGNLIMRDFEGSGADAWNLDHVGQISFEASSMSSPLLTVNYRYDATVPLAPLLGPSRFLFSHGSRWPEGTLKIGNQAGVLVDTGCEAPNIVTDNNHPPDVQGASFPTIIAEGGARVLRVVAGQGPFPGFPDTATDLGLRWSGAVLVNGFVIGLGGGPGIVNRQFVRAVGTIVATPGAVVDIREAIDCDFSGGVLSNMVGNLTTIVGLDFATVTTPPFATTPQPAAAGGNVVTFPWRLTIASYSAVCEADNAAVLPLAVSGRAADGCVAEVAAGGGNISVIVFPKSA